MTEYCEICGEELDPDDQLEGICKSCKLSKEADVEYEKDEDYIDPGVN